MMINIYHHLFVLWPILLLLLLNIFSINAWSPNRVNSFPCPPDHVFYPCGCSVVSFDDINYYSQITCSAVNGKQIKEVFHRVRNSYSNVSNVYDILEIRNVPILNICCEDMLEGFKFKTLKIIDSKLCVIHLNSFISTHEWTNEIVLMDIILTPNLIDGQQLFRVIKNFPYLRGLYIITSNLEIIPQDAFRERGFGTNLEVIRVCNSQIRSLFDYTFNNLPNLKWIDFGNNQIDRVSSKTFSLQLNNNNRLLEISLSGNRLTSDQISDGAFSDITIPIQIYLNENKLTTLDEHKFSHLLNRSNYQIYVEKNPFICDCRHRWLFNNEEYLYRLKDINCVEDGKSLWTHNLPNICDRGKIVIPTISTGEIFRKCCRKIKYLKEHDDHVHSQDETIFIPQKYKTKIYIEQKPLIHLEQKQIEQKPVIIHEQKPIIEQKPVIIHEPKPIIVQKPIIQEQKLIFEPQRIYTIHKPQTIVQERYISEQKRSNIPQVPIREDKLDLERKSTERPPQGYSSNFDVNRTPILSSDTDVNSNTNTNSNSNFDSNFDSDADSDDGFS